MNVLWQSGITVTKAKHASNIIKSVENLAETLATQFSFRHLPLIIAEKPRITTTYQMIYLSNKNADTKQQKQTTKLGKAT